MKHFARESSIIKYIFEHKRAVKHSFLVFIITFILGLGFSAGIVKLFQERAPFEMNFIQTIPSEIMITILKVAVLFALIISIPIIVYYLVKPTFKKAEDKKQFVITLAGGALLFLIGALFAYWLIIPITLYFLIGFNFNLATVTLTVSSYTAFCLLTTVISGLIFELPLIIYVLKKLNLLKNEILLKYWKYIVSTAVLIPVLLISNELFEIIFYSAVFLLIYFLIVFIAKIYK